MTRFYLSLGSNVGPREENLARALGLLRDSGVSIDEASSTYETSPVGEAAGPRWFLNLVAGGQSSLAPAEILARCAAVERRMGRERTVRGGPRTIDIDLLLAGDAVEDSERCTVPHPRMHERRFVLEPHAEIAPDARHPRLGLTITDLLDSLGDRTAVRRLTGSSALLGGPTRPGDPGARGTGSHSVSAGTPGRDEDRAAPSRPRARARPAGRPVGGHRAASGKGPL